MTQTYEQLRTRLAELVPDIKKLEFGCEVEYLDTRYLIVKEKSEGFYLMSDGKIWTEEMLTQAMYLEILGRDPSLADVLRAIGKKHLEVAVIHLSYHNFIDILLPAKHKKIRYQADKPLSGQSQETLDFIGELIKDH